MIFLNSINRLRHSYGYGVQSPFAYDFMMKVVRQRGAKFNVTDATMQQSKLHRLYFRLEKYWLSNTENAPNNHKIARIDIAEDYEKAINSATENTLLVVENINKNKKTKRLWRKITNDQRTGITFDLYKCGIVFFDLTMHKQNYTAYL